MEGGSTDSARDSLASNDASIYYTYRCVASIYYTYRCVAHLTSGAAESIAKICYLNSLVGERSGS